jgi:hypothetical protein
MSECGKFFHLNIQECPFLYMCYLFGHTSKATDQSSGFLTEQTLTSPRQEETKLKQQDEKRTEFS